MNCYALVIHQDFYSESCRGAIIASKSIQQYLITFHDEDCGHLNTYGPHYHIMIWANKAISDITLGRRLHQQGVNKVDYVYERTKNELSMLMYVTHPPRQEVERHLDDATEQKLQSITAEQRLQMSAYILNRGRPVPEKETSQPIAPQTGKKFKVSPADAFKLVLKYKTIDYHHMLRILMQDNPDLYWIKNVILYMLYSFM